ncbi:DUF481 domain-containing protein [Psychroflexus salinarum]|uniref:DUF481 domain-containing protein n=1 Tax=Psychroflexus salinarum TaxID=546024 RepID=A0ABW3GNL1_9FLAO
MKCKFKTFAYSLFSIVVVSAVFFNCDLTYSQTDSLHLKTGDILVGELMEMKQNVATFKTDYSDSDFKIKWKELVQLKTKTGYLITLSSGEHFSGQLMSTLDGEVAIVSQTDTLATTTLKDIVFLKQIDYSFWGNLEASLSLGYNFAKANNLSQYSVRSNLGYRTKGWSASTSYNHIVSTQSDVFTTQRLDANLVYKHYFKRKWFGLGEVNWLSNTAQNIDLRTLSKLGFGRYLIRTNSLYWGLQTGVSFNQENFSSESLSNSRSSSEAFLGTEANLYDIGDLNLLSRVVVYPSFTESGRWRTDFSVDIKYDLPLDFFINLGLSLNYDNQPANTPNKTDYIFQTTLGWSL